MRQNNNQTPTDDNGNGVLAGLRQQIEDVDRRFAELLSRRQALALQVAQRKIEHGIPLRNYSVERQVISRFAGLCEERGDKRRWGVELANFLIEKSLEVQSNQLEKLRHGDRLKALVIGGLGKMGRWMCGFLHNQGHDVSVLDIRDDETPFPCAANLEDGVLEADVVIVCVPLGDSPAVLTEVIAQRPAGVVVDICSFKKNVAPLLREAAASGLRVTSLHPLFGPDAVTLSGRNIVLCSCGSPEADDLLLSLFADTAANLVQLSLEEHDRLIGLTLGLSHALNMIFALTLAGSGEQFSRLCSVASTTFSKQIDTTIEIVSENLELYFEIQSHIESEATFQLLSRALEEFHRVIATGNFKAFKETMLRSSEYLTKPADETAGAADG